jgi:hypothetical protein
LFEFTWKGQLRALYPTVQGYQSVLADVATYTGGLTLATMFVSRLIFQYLGWGVAASVTPVVMGVAGAVFFGTSVMGGMPGLPEGLAATLLSAGAVAGVVTQVFARASKYSLFDPAKEMVYIEMDKEEKSKGKAAVDLVGSQIGKSGASWMTQAFLIMCGSLSAAMPFVGVCFGIVIVTWVGATLSLHRQMQEVEDQREIAAKIEAEEAAAAEAAAATAGSGSSNGGPNGSSGGNNGLPLQTHVVMGASDGGSSSSSNGNCSSEHAVDHSNSRPGVPVTVVAATAVTNGSGSSSSSNGTGTESGSSSNSLGGGGSSTGYANANAGLAA